MRAGPPSPAVEPLAQLPPVSLLPPPPPPLDTWAIRHSLESVSARGTQVAADFYGYLFTACPHVREMFPAVMSAQDERLFAAIVKITQLLDRPDTLGRYLTQLGADHRKYGVQPEHYAPVGDALIRTLRRHCEAWDDRAEAAWMAAYTVASDAMIAGAQACTGPPWYRGRVVRHERRTADVVVLDIETDLPIPYEPGQYITVQHGKWPRVWRQFSLATAPDGSGHIELHVRRVPGGWVSTALTRDAGDGTEVIIGPPVGGMTARAAADRDLLLVAGGVGLAPMKALAQQVLADDESAMAVGEGMRRSIALFWGAKTPLELYEMPVLRQLEQWYPWLQVVPVISGTGNFNGLTGNVSEAVLDYDSWAEREAYLAGPAEMVTAAAEGLCAAGVPEDRVHFDEVGV
ncbi:MAG TPA: globin domain-containing protein [Streptosporangiaceae bacterium]|nr:globin domain-containing protein [Streptosporangiaceae bacterium]